MSAVSEPRGRRLALTFIFITMFVDTIGLGLIIPVAPKIIIELTGDGMSAALYGGWLGFTYAAMLFLCSPLVGNLSDRFGRRPVLIVSLLTLGIDYAITGLAPTIWWLFIGRFLSGMAGASYTTVIAYIADVSPQRSVRPISDSPSRPSASASPSAPRSLMGLSMPAINGILSKEVGPKEQGELQGALASIGGVTSIVAPPLLTHVSRGSHAPMRRSISRAQPSWRRD